MQNCLILFGFLMFGAHLTEATFWLYNLFDPPQYVEPNYQRAIANLRTIAIEKRRLQLLGLYPIVVNTEGMRSEDLNANDYYDYYGDYMTSDYEFEREYDERMYAILKRQEQINPVRRKKVSKPKKVKEMYITKSRAKSASKSNNAYRVNGVGNVYLQSKSDYEQIRIGDQNEPTKRRFDSDIRGNDFVDIEQKNYNEKDSKTVLTTLGLINAISRLTTSTTTVPTIENTPTERTLAVAPIVEKIISLPTYTVQDELKSKTESSNNLRANQPMQTVPDISITNIDFSDNQLPDNSTFYNVSNESGIDESEEFFFSTTMSSLDLLPNYGNESNIKVVPIQYEETTQTIINTTEDLNQLTISDKPYSSVEIPIEENTTENQIKEGTITKQSSTSPFINNELQFPSDNDHIDSFFDEQLTTNSSSIKPIAAKPSNASTTTFKTNPLDYQITAPDHIVFIDEEEPFAPPSFIADFHNYQSSLDSSSGAEFFSGENEYDINDSTTVVIGGSGPRDIPESTSSQTALTDTTDEPENTYSPLEPAILSEENKSEAIQSNQSVTENVNNEPIETTTDYIKFNAVEIKTELFSNETTTPSTWDEPTTDAGASIIASESKLPSTNNDSALPYHAESTDLYLLLNTTTEPTVSNDPQKPESMLNNSDGLKMMTDAVEETANNEINQIIANVGRLVAESQNVLATTMSYEAVILTSTESMVTEPSIVEVQVNTEFGITDNSTNSTDEDLRNIDDLQEETADLSFAPDVKEQIDTISARISEIMENAISFTESGIPTELQTEEEVFEKTTEYFSADGFVGSQEDSVQLTTTVPNDFQTQQETSTTFVESFPDENDTSITMEKLPSTNNNENSTTTELRTTIDKKSFQSIGSEVPSVAEDLPMPEPSARNLEDNAVDEPIYRRSDVLAEAEYATYDDDDLSITVNEMTHLNQLKLIPLIPVLIEQLRLGRVNAAEMDILQQIFGAEFWQLILSEVQSNTSLAEMNATLAKIMQEKQQTTMTTEPSVMASNGSKRRKRSPTFRRLRNERRRQRLLLRRLQLEASRSQWSNNDDRGLTVNIGLNDAYGGVSRRQPTFYLN